MGISYGLQSIKQIKCVDHNGVLSNVERVVRNGKTIWAPGNFLTFTAVEPSVVTADYTVGSSAFYRKNWGVWTEMPRSTEISMESGDVVQMRALNLQTDVDNHFGVDGYVLASGSINSLIDGIGDDPDVKVLSLEYMFDGCKGLKTPPELPSKNIKSSCYLGMFESSGIESPPALPATSLWENCYKRMFSSCKSLKTAPVLPATSLAVNCYEWMFGNCSALENMPALPATTLYAGCYNKMFHSCTALAGKAELPAEILQDSCYDQMFYNCDSMTAIEMGAKRTEVGADYCCFMMLADSGINEVTVKMESFLKTERWMEDMSSGVFHCTPTLKAKFDDGTYARSDSTVPSGWTIIGDVAE